MASALATSTPSPPPGLRTPPAPRLGFYDSWEPYSPRKSARISSQRVSNRTPSPRASHHQQSRSPRGPKKSAPEMVSPVPSPLKKRQSAPDSTRHASGTLTAEGTASAAAALGLKHKSAQPPANTMVAHAAGTLPTPSKTPQKPPNEKTAANIKSFARHLFASSEESAPSPKKKRAKKYSGISMESFRAEEVEDPIEIFTDSHDRVPVKDDSASNPFYGDNPAPVEPTKRRSKRRQVNIPGEGPQSVDEAARREDGMVYVFRGKKFFRKFAENDGAQSEEQQDVDADVDAQLSRPLNRSEIKPRRLFQAEKTEAMIEDEEATTDVEDLHMSDDGVNPQTPTKRTLEEAKTPEAPKFAPVSPPDTKRTTRSTNKFTESATPMKSTGKKSPFDSWPRTKEHKDASAGKRHGESLAQSQAKRSRA